MDTVLIAVTLISLGLATALGVLTARLLREDRARADARVAVLSALAAETAPPAPADIDVGQPSPVPPAPDLFSPHDAPSPWGRRMAIAGAVAAITMAAVVASIPGHPTASPASRQAAEPREGVAAPAGAPLELLSLHHARDANGLTISGVVRNPGGGSPVRSLTVTAYVFGPGGSFLTSGRAPVDVPALAPGAESPFEVALPVSGDVSRYRVGFRGPDGGVLTHVDRRLPDTLASRQEQR